MDRFGVETLLLVWLENEVSWDGGKHEISFTSSVDPAAQPRVIRDGDNISVVGVLLRDGDSLMKSLLWRATPGAGCRGHPFIVESVEVGP